MRTVGAGNSAQPTGALNDLTDSVIIKIADASDALVDLTSYAVSLDYHIEADQKADAATVVLRREKGGVSLAPLMYASNPPIAVGRRFVVLLNPGSGTYTEIFRGRITDVAWPERFGDITVQALDQAGVAGRAWVRSTNTYGSTAGVSLETVMQDVLDDNMVTPPTLYFPSPTSAVVQHIVGDPAYSPAGQSVLDAMTALVESIGWTLRWRHFGASASDWKWTAFDPLRTKTVADYTFGPNDYWDVVELEQSDAEIRNTIEVEYVVGGALASVVVTDPVSIAKYNAGEPLYALISEGSDSPVNNATLATDLATAALLDLSEPDALMTITTRFFWPGEVSVDLYAFTANGKHFSSTIKLAPIAFHHRIAVGERPTTKMTVRGKPSGGSRMWRRRRDGADVPDPDAPLAKIRLKGDNGRLLTVEFASVVDASKEPITWRYRIVGDSNYAAGWTAGVGALPQQKTFSKSNLRQASIELEITQADLKTDTATFEVQGKITPAIDAGTGRKDEDDTRSGPGGVPTRFGRIPIDPVYSADGTQPLINTTTKRFTTDLSGPTGVTATVIETGGNRGFGGFTSLTGDLVSTAKDSRAAPLNNHFRYGTDSAVGVVETATQSFTHQSYLDASRRPKLIRDQTLNVDVVANDINVGQSRARGGFTDATGSLVSTAKDSRAAPLNQHFRANTDNTSAVVDGPGSPLTGGARGFLGLDTNSKLVTGVTSAATGADGYSGIESRRGAARQSGHSAQGITREGFVRAGNGGLPVLRAQFVTDPLYSADGTTPLVDPVTKEIKSGLAIGTGVRGAADVAFGATVKYPTSRHNEDILGKHLESKTFGVSYEQVPNIRAIPLCYSLPGSAAKIEVKVINVTVSGFDIRAVSSTGSSSSAETDSFSASLNGAEFSSIAISAPGAAAYCNLDDANTTLTTYKVVFDVDTLLLDVGVIMRVRVYKNNGTGSTSWSQVASANYDSGLSLTNQVLQFNAAMAANWDVQVVVSYTATPFTNGTVTCKRVDYNKITPGTETDITTAADAAILVQAAEVS